MTRARDVANLIGSGNYSSTTFTATAGQTAFTISHTQGFVQVFMNGLLLDETVDYTSNGSAVTLTSGAAAGDEIEVVAYNTFSVGDALNQAAADTRYVNATGDAMTGNLTTTGDVGVGETSPNLGSSGTGLHIKGAASKDGVIKLDSQTADRSGIVQFTENGTDKWRIGYDAANNHLEFTRSGVADRMLISDDGYITLPNLPAFTVYNNAAITITTNGDHHVTFNTARLNRGSHFSLANNVFTVPATGLYFFTATIAIHSQESTQTDDSQYITFRINGVELGRNAGSLGTMTNSRYHTQNGVELSQGISMVLDLSTNDTVGLEYGDVQSDVKVANAVFSGYMIG